MAKDIAKVWTFPSGSNPSKTYETLQMVDGSTSCNCMGWCRRVAADGSRTCKHTRLVDQGRADTECVGHKDYSEVNRAPAVRDQIPQKNKAVAEPVKETVKPRKIIW